MVAAPREVSSGDALVEFAPSRDCDGIDCVEMGVGRIVIEVTVIASGMPYDIADGRHSLPRNSIHRPWAASTNRRFFEQFDAFASNFGVLSAARATMQFRKGFFAKRLQH
jgi:hypothetical protein